MSLKPNLIEQYVDRDGRLTIAGIKMLNDLSSEASGLPAGGTAGQVLTKQSTADGDADWEGFIISGGGA